jgi:hypothetical protein
MKIMDKGKFDAVFPIICSDLAKKIGARLNLSDKDIVTRLYASHLYELLEHEETKLWQYSSEKLLELFLEEATNGNITFPQI